LRNRNQKARFDSERSEKPARLLAMRHSNASRSRIQRIIAMFRKTMLALAALTAIGAASTLPSTEASAGFGWGKHHGHHLHFHGFHRFGIYNAYAPTCGYVYTRRGFLKYVCY
jgi:hypothetical protein